ncbi:MipA/OmpV family protein [Uliginosibacterium sp. H3]|uniref:MipA/OmpV family protein n=1 Tax=Uliginosibacterium silvisoli TaxID=3114758 RepID=A0ABU6JZV9_9RHOO|nr:MipA/OmpV family protein [Uliginosibacterium sp. H3]
MSDADLLMRLPALSAFALNPLVLALAALCTSVATSSAQAQTDTAPVKTEATQDAAPVRKLGAILGNTPEKQLPVKLLPLWEFGLGVGGFSLPDYRGSDHQSNYLFPLPYFVYRGEFLRADRTGLSGRFLDTDHLDIEFSLGGGAPVQSKDNSARAGMPDLKPTVEFGAQAIIRLIGDARAITRLDLRLPVRQAFTVSGNPRAVGMVFTPAINLSITPKGTWEFGAQTGPYYANASYYRYIYEVPTEYATPTRPAYTPQGGYGGWQVTTSLSRRFDTMYVGAFVRASTVKGAVFDGSPLVRRQNNVMAGFGISWIFSRSSEWVPATDDD